MQHLPLWSLTARALRLWLFLAMKAQHAPFARTLGDSQRVTIQSGQFLTSNRKLARDAGYRSPKALIADLKELAKQLTIEITPIKRLRFRIGTAPVSKTEPSPRFQNGNADSIVATLITVRGISQLRDQGVSESETKREKSTLRALSRDEREWQKAEAVFMAEGR
jgi:hypothetical protein